MKRTHGHHVYRPVPPLHAGNVLRVIPDACPRCQTRVLRIAANHHVVSCLLCGWESLVCSCLDPRVHDDSQRVDVPMRRSSSPRVLRKVRAIVQRLRGESPPT
jgi:hypothetical protein